jgi:hypothetical protein
LLFEAGATSRLGSVADGTTVSDADEDEKSRNMSISASLASFEWRDVKVNLIDTPGEPSFIADALGALRVCESAIFVVNGVMGVEVSTRRLWERAQELHVARLVYVNMLDRERADFFRTLDSLKEAFGPHVVATEIPIGAEHELSGLIDLVDMKAYTYADGVATEIPIPDELREQAQEYREKLMDEVAENSEALMERYLEGEEISHDEIVHALEEGTDTGHIFPVTCGVATTRLGANRLLEAVIDDLPSPAQHERVQVDRRVLLLQPAQRGVDLVLVALVLGLHGERHDRGGEFDARHVDRLVARGQPVAGVGLLELGHGADVARAEAVGVADVLASRHEQLADALLVMGARVHDLRVVGHRALVDAEEVDAARERIGARLEHVGEHLALGVGLEREALFDLDAPVLHRAREVVADGVEQPVGAQPRRRHAARDREDVAMVGAVLERLDDLVV